MPLFNKATAYFLFSFIYLFSVSNGFGQVSNNISFSGWQKENGLPSNNILAIEKDKLGFLWIATNDGLCRYDGPNLIKIYRQVKNDTVKSNTLNSSNIRALHCDSQGFLWIGTRFGGLTRFNPATNEWKTFRHNPNIANSLSHDEVLTIFEDSKNNIWVGTERGLNLYDPTDFSFTQFMLYDEQKKETSRAILTIVEDQQGWIWVGTWSGGLHLLLIDEKGEFNQKQTRHIQTTSDRSAKNVFSLLEDKSGNHWIGTHGGGLLLMHLPSNASNHEKHQNWQPSFHKYLSQNKYALNLKSNDIQIIIQDQYEDLWLGTTRGLCRVSSKILPSLNPKQQLPLDFELFSNSANDQSTLVGNNIMDLLEDDQGLIWIATTDGLNQYNEYSNQFKSFKLTLGEHKLGFASNFFIDQDKNIWVGASNGGLQQFLFKDNKLVRSPSDINDLIMGNQILTIHSPDNEWLYVGTEKGITAIELKTLKTKKYPIPDWLRSKLHELIITSILVDKNDFIWMGTKTGLFKIDPFTKAYSFYEHDLNNPNSISDNPINHIIQDSKGAIWVATYKGINRIADPSQKELIFEKFFFNASFPEKGPMNNEIMHLKEVDTYLYIGTISGICRFDYSTNLFESFNAAKQKYWVRSIEKDLNNNIWLSTNEGIIHFDPQKKAFRSFDKKDGLVNNSFQLGCSFTDINEDIYFAYNDGFVYFSPKTLKSNEKAPPVYITDIERMTSKGTILEDGIHQDEITLKHNDYRLSINFAALNYNRGDKNQYAYRLVGFEELWNEGKIGTPIVYTNLAQKKYKLEVRAANNDGVWNEVGTSLTIIQKPPYWETWWFRLLALTLFVTSFLLTIALYTNNIRKRNEELRAFNDSLNNEIANRKRIELQLSNYNDELKRSNKDLEQFAYIASHDLKEPLRVIGSFSSLLSHRYSDKLDKNGLEYLNFIENGVMRMSNLLSSILTYSTVGRKDSTYKSIDLNQVVKRKNFDLSQIIKDKNAFVQIEQLPNIVGHSEQIGMVFFNLIHNAIKFNTQKQPHIIVQEEESITGFWKFSIKDNGIGIEKVYKDKIFGIFKRLHGKQDYEGTGIGLSVCLKIIQRHQGNIWFESIYGKGTTFYFTIKKDLLQESIIDEPEEELIAHE